MLVLQGRENEVFQVIHNGETLEIVITKQEQGKVCLGFREAEGKKNFHVSRKKIPDKKD